MRRYNIMIIMIETPYNLYTLWGQKLILISAAAEHNDIGFITAPFRIFFFF